MSKSTSNLARDHRVAFEISEEAYQRLRIAAAHRGISTTRFMSNIMEDYAKKVSVVSSENSVNR